MDDDRNQKRVPLLDQNENIDSGLLQQIADALKVHSDAVHDFDEEAAMINIQHNYDGSNNQGPNNGSNNNCIFNPLEKWLEALEENKRLYEALLKSERDKNMLLERLLAEKSK
jgi:hypothetical protein